MTVPYAPDLLAQGAKGAQALLLFHDPLSVDGSRESHSNSSTSMPAVRVRRPRPGHGRTAGAKGSLRRQEALEQLRIDLKNLADKHGVPLSPGGGVSSR